MSAQRIHAGSDFNVLIPLESISTGMTHSDYLDVKAYLVDRHGGLRAQFSKVAATGFNQWIQEADRGTVLNIVIPLDNTITRFLERGTYSLKVAFYFTDAYLPDQERIQSDSQDVITIVDDDEPTDELSEMVFYYAILNNGGNAIQIQGIDVTETAPTDGQILVYNEETDELEYADHITNQFDTIEFNTSYTPTGDEPIGSEYWDADNHTKTTVLEYGVLLQNGFELLKLANDEGNDFFEGAAVSVKGATGNRVAIELTNFSSSSTNVNKFIGLVTSAPDSGNRIILRYGDINGINTVGGLSYGSAETWVEGNEIWGDVLHPGYMTNVEPTGASNYKVFIGTITVASATVGQISTNFRIYQNGTEIVSLIDTLYGTTWRSERTASTTSFTPYEAISATEVQTAMQQLYDLIPTETTITTLTEDVAISKAATQTYTEVFTAANLPLLWGGYDVHVYHTPETHNVGDIADAIETLGYFGGRLIMHNALDGEGQSTDLTTAGTNQPATINFNGTGNFRFVNLGVQVIFDSLKLTTDADNNNQLIYALGGLNGSSHFCYWDFDAGTLADSACVFGDAQWTFDNDVFRESSTIAAQNSCAIEMSGGIGVGRNGRAVFINCTTTGGRPFLTGAKGVGEASFKDSDTAFTNQAGSESTDNVIVLTDQTGTIDTVNLSFSTTIDLSNLKSESSGILTANSDFTPVALTSVVDGNSHYMHLQLDGYTPTFSGFKFMETQLTKPEETTGYVNVIMFFRMFGIYYYTILDSYLFDQTASNLLSATVENLTDDQLDLVFDEIVNITADGWSITASGGAVTITSVLNNVTTSPSFTLSRSIAEGETITLDYDSATGSTEDQAGNPLDDITDFSVTNNVTSLIQLNAPALSNPVVDSATQVTVTITDNNTSPNEVNTAMQYKLQSSSTWLDHGNAAQDATSYAYTGLTAASAYDFRCFANGDGIITEDSYASNIVQATTSEALSLLTAAALVNLTASGNNFNAGNTTNWNNYGLMNEYLNTGDDAQIVFDIDSLATNMSVMVGFDAANTNKNYTTWDYGVFASTAGTLQRILNGAIGALDTTTNIIVGDSIMIARESGNIVIKHSSDRSTYTTVHNFGAVSGTFYVNINVQATPGVLYYPRHTGLTTP